MGRYRPIFYSLPSLDLLYSTTNDWLCLLLWLHIQRTAPVWTEPCWGYFRKIFQQNTSCLQANQGIMRDITGLSFTLNPEPTDFSVTMLSVNGFQLGERVTIMALWHVWIKKVWKVVDSVSYYLQLLSLDTMISSAGNETRNSSYCCQLH